MPKGRRVISPNALEDLKSIEDYIAEHDGETRADKFTARINKTIDMLALMPGIGGTRPYLKSGRRAFPVRPWLIVYVPLKDGVRVLRVIDSRRNLSAIFGKEP